MGFKDKVKKFFTGGESDGDEDGASLDGDQSEGDRLDDDEANGLIFASLKATGDAFTSSLKSAMSALRLSSGDGLRLKMSSFADEALGLVLNIPIPPALLGLLLLLLLLLPGATGDFDFSFSCCFSFSKSSSELLLHCHLAILAFIKSFIVAFISYTFSAA